MQFPVFDFGLVHFTSRPFKLSCRSAGLTLCVCVTVCYFSKQRWIERGVSRVLSWNTKRRELWGTVIVHILMYANSCFHSDTTRLFSSTVTLLYRWGVCSVVRTFSLSILPHFILLLFLFFPFSLQMTHMLLPKMVEKWVFSFTQLAYSSPTPHQLSSPTLLIPRTSSAISSLTPIHLGVVGW